MSIPEVIYQELRALVADRVYPSVFPQGDRLPTWPAIRFTLVSADPEPSLCGTNDEGTDSTRVQVDIVASTYDGMRALKAQVIAALETTDPPCVREPGGFETYDAETKTHRATVDFTFYPSSEP